MTAHIGKPFMVKLSDEHRQALDFYRARQGLKSDAEAVRHMIDHCAAIGQNPVTTRQLGPVPAPRAPLAERLTMPRAPAGSRLKPSKGKV